MQRRLLETNPNAFRDMVTTFLEANGRGYWDTEVRFNSLLFLTELLLINTFITNSYSNRYARPHRRKISRSSRNFIRR